MERNDFLPAIPDQAVRLHKGVDLRLRPSLFRTEVKRAIALSGTNLLEALRHACHTTDTPIAILRTAIVHVNGVRVEREHWADTLLQEKDLVSVTVPVMGGGGGGGKNPLATILQVVVIAVAAIATWYVGGTGSILGITALNMGSTAGAIAGGLVMMGGMLLVSALCPASMPRLSAGGDGSNESSQKIWSIDGAQNKVDPYGCVPTVLGKIRVAPRFAAQSYSVISGNDQYVRYLYVVSTGDCAVSEPRIGDTDLSNYQGNEILVHRNWTGSTLRWFQQAKTEESLSIEMKQSIGWQTRTTAHNTTHIMCVIIFEGLKHINENGEASSVSVEVGVRFRRVGETAWQSLTSARSISTEYDFTLSEGSHCLGVNGNGSVGVDSGTPFCYFNVTTSVNRTWENFGNGESESWGWNETVTYYPTVTGYANGFSGTVSFPSTGSRYCRVTVSGTMPSTSLIFTGCTINPLRKCIEWDVSEGQYEVSLCRVSPDSDDESTKSTTRDVFTWTLLQSGRNRPAVIGDSKHPLTLIELQLKASEQLSGNVDEFNVLAHSTAPCYSSGGWTTRTTSNPAALAVRIATGTDIGKPAAWSELDMDSFAGFYQWCEKHGWAYNSWITSKTSAGEVIHNVLSAGRGSYALLNGHGVIWDDPDATVVDMLTQRNSWNFSSQKALVTEQVHGLRMRFLNEDADYQEDERVVYMDGYSASNATNVIEWEQDGVTNKDLIWKHGRLRLAEMRLRPEVYSVQCEAESIALRRGDCIRVVHDVTLWGVTSGMITHVERNASGGITGIELDEFCPMGAGQSYGVRITNKSTTDAYYSVETEPDTETRVLRFRTTLPSSTDIAIGDLVGFGRTQSVGAICKVLSVTPAEGFSATVTMCDAAPNIYDALTGDIPEWDSQITRPNRYQAGKPKAPIIIGIVSDDTVLRINPDGSISPQMLVTCQIPDQPVGVVPYAVICYIREHGSQENWISYSGLVNGQDTVSVLCTSVEEGKVYDIRCQISTGAGILSPFTAIVQHKVVGKTSVPPNITGLKARLLDPEGIELTWDELDSQYLALNLFDHFEISGSLSAVCTTNRIVLQPYRMVGLLTFSVVAIDRTGTRSLVPATVSITVEPPMAPVITSAKLLDPGVVIAWLNAKTSWTIDRYVLTLQGQTHTVQGLSTILPASAPFQRNTPVTAQAQDIFQNWGEACENYIVQIFPPKTPEIVVGCNKLNGCITIDWQDCQNDVEDAPRISHYQITGTLVNQNNKAGIVTVQGTHYESVVPLTAYEYGTQQEDGILINVGTISIGVEAFDKYGISNKDADDYKDNTVSFSIYPPYNPTDMALGTSAEGDSIVLTWKDCERTFAISYYTVFDRFTGREYKVDTNYVVLPPRKEGTYQVTVQAFDVIGFESSAMTYNMSIAGVGGMTVTGRIDGADILVEWSIPSASFSLDHYIIKGDNDVIPDEDNISFEDGDTLGTAKTNFFRMPAGAAGTYAFYVWAVDVAGNISSDYASYCVVTVNIPVAPTVSVALEDEGLRLTWAAGEGVDTLPVAAWDVIRQWEDSTGTKEEDYGRLDVTSVAVPAVTAGEHSFLVRGIDTGGNIGPWGHVDLSVNPPGRITFLTPTVIDNNVQLYWMQPNYIFFPIREYIFSEIDEDGYEMEIGRVDALFASETESTSGTYTYAITPVDTGGNLGIRTTITCNVAQPPDFVFYDKVDSLFNGEKTNMVLDGHGGLLGPVLDGETWEENAVRVIALASLAATTDTLTHQQKVDAGYKTWLEPIESVGTYVETIDHGTMVPSSNISVTVGYTVLGGSPTITCKIEVSQDGSEWVEVSDNAFKAYATQFCYSRFTLTVTGGYVRIYSILVDLNVKQLTDCGRVECKATDNGSGWVSEAETPMLTGTWVPFTKVFVDVQSLPKPNVVNHEEYTAFTVFEDIINPTGFRIFVKDQNGNRVTAMVDWIALGV